MKILIILTFLTLLSFGTGVNLASSLLTQNININYQDLTASQTNLFIIQDKYKVFKEKVDKNTTLQYNSCVESIKTLKCNNIDQWVSVIAELKLEIQNSEQIEIPFLMKQKEEKIFEYRDTLWMMRYLDYDHYYQKEILEQFQKGLDNSTKQIKIMYKLPEEIKEESEFVQKTSMQQDIEPAKESLQKAKEEYDLADISIQAQTTANVMTSLSNKLPNLQEEIQQFYDQQYKLLAEKKSRTKQEILHLRALLQNEQLIQQKNKDKIAELNAKIDQCKGKPTNIEKDCGPILVIAEKLYTEIDIINTRTNAIIKEINNLLIENGQQLDNKNYQEYQKMVQGEQEFQKELDFANQEEDQAGQAQEKVHEPIEQVPKHTSEHLSSDESQSETNPPKVEEEEQGYQELTDNQVTTSEPLPDSMIFSYKNNPDYQSTDNNNQQQQQQNNIAAQLEDDDESSLDKLLEKEFQNEDNSNGEQATTDDDDIYADKFDYNE